MPITFLRTALPVTASPPWVAGRFYPCGSPWLRSTAGAFAYTAWDFYAVATWVPNAVTLATVSVNVGSGGTNLRIGCYLPDPDTFWPGKLKQDFGSLDVSGTGAVSVSPSLYLSAGLYWFASIANAVVSVLAGSGGPPHLGFGSDIDTTVGNNVDAHGSNAITSWVADGLPRAFPPVGLGSLNAVYTPASAPLVFLGV